MEKEARTHDHTREIAELAYSYWERRGYQDGHDVEDWLEAEQEVRRRLATQEEERYHTSTAA